MARVTLKRKPYDRGRWPGLPSGWHVNVGGEQVGSVDPLTRGFAGGKIVGWYFAVRDDDRGIPLRSTCGEIGVSEDDAKAAAVAYVKECLRTAKDRQKKEPNA